MEGNDKEAIKKVLFSQAKGDLWLKQEGNSAKVCLELNWRLVNTKVN